MAEGAPASPFSPLAAAAAEGAVAIGKAAVRDLREEARKDRGLAWRWGAIVIMFGMLAVLTYLLVKDARDGHAMTKPEYEEANVARDLKQDEAEKERSQRVEALRVQFVDATLRLAVAVESIAGLKDEQRAMRTEMKASESRLTERLDRVLEAVRK